MQAALLRWALVHVPLSAAISRSALWDAEAVRAVEEASRRALAEAQADVALAREEQKLEEMARAPHRGMQIRPHRYAGVERTPGLSVARDADAPAHAEPPSPAGEAERTPEISDVEDVSDVEDAAPPAHAELLSPAGAAELFEEDDASASEGGALDRGETQPKQFAEHRAHGMNKGGLICLVLTLAVLVAMAALLVRVRPRAVKEEPLAGCKSGSGPAWQRQAAGADSQRRPPPQGAVQAEAERHGDAGRRSGEQSAAGHAGARGDSTQDPWSWDDVSDWVRDLRDKPGELRPGADQERPRACGAAAAAAAAPGGDGSGALHGALRQLQYVAMEEYGHVHQFTVEDPGRAARLHS